MMKPGRLKKVISPLIISVLAVFLASCGTATREAVSQLDTPGHHTYAGLKLLGLGKYADAQREFKMAIQLNSNYSRAYTGLALIYMATGKYDHAEDNLEAGAKRAQTNDEKLFVNVSKIRYYTASKADPNWLEMAKNQFRESVLIDIKHAPVYYYMGLAYKEALEFNFANQMFIKVTELKTDHLFEAEAQLKFIDLYIQAKPTTQVGKKIANVEKITRADVAALFVEELKIKDIVSQASAKGREPSSKETESSASQMKDVEKTYTGATLSAPSPFLANDIFDHPLKHDIEVVLRSGIRGLENDPNGNFRPGEIISRGEYAVMLEDIIIKLTGKKDLATRYLKAKPSFLDVPVDMPYFNAIMSVTSLDIMETKKFKTGEFAPLKPLSGLEAMIIIRKLKEKLQIN